MKLRYERRQSSPRHRRRRRDSQRENRERARYGLDELGSVGELDDLLTNYEGRNQHEEYDLWERLVERGGIGPTTLQVVGLTLHRRLPVNGSALRESGIA